MSTKGVRSPTAAQGAAKAVTHASSASAAGRKGARGSAHVEVKASLFTRGIPSERGTLIGDLALFARTEHPREERREAAERLSGTHHSVFTLKRLYPIRHDGTPSEALEARRERIREAFMKERLLGPDARDGREEWARLVAPLLLAAASEVTLTQPLESWSAELRRSLARDVARELLGRTLDEGFIQAGDQRVDRVVAVPIEGSEEEDDDGGPTLILPQGYLDIAWERADLLFAHVWAMNDLRDALTGSGLSPNQQAVLIGYSMAEGDPDARRDMAGRLGITEAALRKRVQRYRERLPDIGDVTDRRSHPIRW